MTFEGDLIHQNSGGHYSEFELNVSRVEAPAQAEVAGGRWYMIHKKRCDWLAMIQMAGHTIRTRVQRANAISTDSDDICWFMQWWR